MTRWIYKPPEMPASTWSRQSGKTSMGFNLTLWVFAQRILAAKYASLTRLVLRTGSARLRRLYERLMCYRLAAWYSRRRME